MSEVQAKLAAAAEPTPQSRAELIEQIAEAVVGKQRAEQMTEARRQREETAQKALEGRNLDTASKSDPANPYGQDWAKVFREMVQPAAPAASEVTSKQALRLWARSVVSSLQADGRKEKAFELAKSYTKDTNHHNFLEKALGLSTVAAGGALFQESVGDPVPALLSETAIVSSPRIMKADLRGGLTIPYESTAGTTDFGAESGNATASQSTFDQIRFTPHFATLIVPMSRSLLQNVPAAEQFVINSMQRKALRDIDEPCLRSTGAADEPVGLRYKAVSGNVLAVNATVSAANTIQDMLRLQQALSDANVPYSISQCEYAFAPRTWRYLAALRDNAGYVFQNEMFALGTIFGAPIAGNSGRGIQYIPTNLAVTDTSESEIYFYNAAGLMFASSPSSGVEISKDAAYVDSGGTVRSSFSRHEMVAKVHMEYDIGDVFQGNGIAVLKDVDWGV
jgi:HK97 family phage major capsid protein